jgi:DNA-binding transcriptional LysR family regulator
MDLTALRIFLTVAEERSFSRAAAKVHRTQPAVSQAVKRLEEDLGEQLFDRSSKSGTLTDAGRVLQNYGQRLVRLAEEAESAMRELRDLRRGRVLIGANEAAIHTLLPLMARFRQKVPDIAIDVRRVPARQIAVEVQQGSLDFGALTFRPAQEGLLEVVVGSDELVLLMSPSHPLSKRRQVTMEEVAGEPVVAHNDPSPARERVLRLFEQRQISLNMVISLPSLDGIKRAVELKLGVALLPRRCAITEIASGHLVAVPVSGISRRRQLTLVCRKAHRSHAANAFLAVAQEKTREVNEKH